MKIRLSSLAGCLLAACLTLPSALAKDLPSGGLTREELVTWLRGKGYEASVKYDDTAKDSYVDTSSKGVNWSIYVYACEADRCKSIQYAAGWSGTDITEATLNVWNRTKRFIRAYRQNEGSVYGEYDIDVIPGGTWESLDKTLDRWESQLASFKEVLEQGNSWANGK